MGGLDTSHLLKLPIDILKVITVHEITKKIIELEKKAKESDYWKDKYQELSNKIKTSIEDLNSLVNIKFTRTYNKGERTQYKYKGSKHDFDTLINVLVLKLKNEEIQEVTTEIIEKELNTLNIPAVGDNMVLTRRLLRKVKEIGERKDGKTVKFFYVETDNDKQELIESLPKKFSYMK